MKVSTKTKSAGIPVVDLYAGAGGLGLGAAMAGGDLRLSIDNDDVCCATLRQNPSNGHEVRNEDVSNLLGDQLRDLAGLTKRDSLVIIGGPPCQPFSKAAYWTDPGHDSRYRKARAKGQAAPKPAPITSPKPDDRRTLVFHFWRLVGESAADAFVFENVPSILHPRNKETFFELRDAFEKLGYRTCCGKVNAVEFGVAQSRTRVFLLGVKGASPEMPAPTHTMNEKERGLKQAVTAGKVLRPFSSDKYFEPEEVVEGRWAEQLREIPPGWNYKALTAWAGHPAPVFEAERRFWNFLLKLSPDLPSWTIAASPGPWTGPFHWNSRRLRTVELAALQGFPTKYRFSGSRRDRVRQIGNAVPPPMAEAMVGALLKTLASTQD